MSSQVAFWVLLGCAFINAFLFFISLAVPQFHHLQSQHLLMLTICVAGCIINYFLSPKEPK